MPAQGLTFRDLRNAILFATGIFILIIFIRDIVDVILLFTLATFIIIILDPFVTRMQKRGIPRWAGTIIIVLVFLGFVGLLLYYIIPVGITQVKQLAATLPKTIDQVKKFMGKVPGLAVAGSSFSLQTVWRSIGPLMGGISTITQDIVYFVAGAVAIFITTIYSLINPRPLVEGFLNFINPEYRMRAAVAMERVSFQIWAWARGTIFAMFTIFVLVWIDLWLLGFKQALLFAIIAGILEIIPVLGPILGGVLPFFVGLAINPILALWVVATFVVIQQFENHVLIPLVMARQVRLHPVTVIVAVFIMGTLFGIIGIFLATPAAVIVGVLYDELYLCEYRKRCEEAGIERSDEARKLAEMQEQRERAEETGRVEEIVRKEEAERVERVQRKVVGAPTEEEIEEQRRAAEEEGRKPFEQIAEEARERAKRASEERQRGGTQEYGPLKPGIDESKRVSYAPHKRIPADEAAESKGESGRVDDEGKEA